MTFADDVATHLDTHYAAAAKPAIIDNWYDQTQKDREKWGNNDIILVLEHPRAMEAVGVAHKNTLYIADVYVWARKKGASANIKARLIVIMDEVEHVLHSENHLIAGYTSHAATVYRDDSDKEKLVSLAPPIPAGEAFGRLSFVAYKKGRGV